MGDSHLMPRKHIAVINHSPDFLLLAWDLFEAEGYRVTTSEFTPSVFNRIVMLQPDALIVDLAFGESAGWGPLERLHEETAPTDIPVLIASTSSGFLEQVQDQADRYGSHRYFLVKPLDLEDLVAAVREMTRNY